MRVLAQNLLYGPQQTMLLPTLFLETDSACIVIRQQFIVNEKQHSHLSFLLTSHHQEYRFSTPSKNIAYIHHDTCAYDYR